MSDLGSWVTMYDTISDTPWSVEPGDAPRIDAAVSRHVDSGGTVDALLDLTTLDGFELRIRASHIAAWFISTPMGRQRSVELNKLQDEERREFRAAVGLWDEE